MKKVIAIADGLSRNFANDGGSGVVNRIWVRGLVASAACLMLLGFQPAVSSAAPDVVGKTYGEAKGILGQAGMSTVVRSTLGDRAEPDKCYVVSTTQMTPLDSSGDPAAFKQVQVNLNCYTGESNRRAPGYSKANNSPEAVAVRATNDKVSKEWKATDKGQAWCAESELEHPDWAPIPDCHSEEEAQAIVDKKWKASPEGQAWCTKFEGEHPEWAPIPDCHQDAVQASAVDSLQPIAAEPTA